MNEIKSLNESFKKLKEEIEPYKTHITKFFESPEIKKQLEQLQQINNMYQELYKESHIPDAIASYYVSVGNGPKIPIYKGTFTYDYVKELFNSENNSEESVSEIDLIDSSKKNIIKNIFCQIDNKISELPFDVRLPVTIAVIDLIRHW